MENTGAPTKIRSSRGQSQHAGTASTTDAPVGLVPAPAGTVQAMEAAVITAPGQVHFTNLPIPIPRAGEVRVRLEGCGICGSNLSPWEGRPWFEYPLQPGEPGHEGWGRVDEVGPGVATVQPGDRVALLSYRAYAEYDVAPETSVVRLPPELDGLPFPGEALGCAMNVFRRADIWPGQTVAIVGIGFLGAVLTALCANAGANVIAISRRQFALEIAHRMGAAATLVAQAFQPAGSPDLQVRSPSEQRQSPSNPQPGIAALVDQVRTLTSGKLCDCVIEAVGRQEPLDLAGELTREGGRLIVGGYHQDGPRHVNMQLWNWRGLDVINAHERDPNVCAAGIRAAADYVATGALDPSPLYTHTFRLNELAQALNAMKERPENFLKAVVTM